MSGEFVFNVAKGRAGQWGYSVDNALLAHDAIVWILLQSSGLESDALLKDRVSLADILTGSSEASFTGYSRLVRRASIVVAVDQVSDRLTINDTTDPTWSPTTAQSLGKIITCYDPDTTGGTDADLIPITADDFAGLTPTSGAILYPVSNNGFFYQAG